jgi:type IV pilus assembly protein PilW
MKSYSEKISVRAYDGFSLIEFMVAILLSTIVLGGAVAVYLVSKRSYVEVEQVAEVSENARFTMQVLTRSFRHIGFFGPVGFLEGQEVDTTRVAGIAVQNDCGAPAQALDLTTTLFAQQLGPAESSIFGNACINDARPGTDVLVVKHLEPTPVYDMDPNSPNDSLCPGNVTPDGVPDCPTALDSETFYVAANGERAALFFGGVAADVPDVSEGEDYALAVTFPYAFNVFYVREDATSGIPRLSRKRLRWRSGSAVVETEDLAEGVENIQYLFGEDTDADPDGIPNEFVNSEQVTDWNRVVTGKVYAITRALQPDTDYVDDKTYTVGDTIWAPTCSILVAGGFNECQYRRILVQSDINLRNPRIGWARR